MSAEKCKLIEISLAKIERSKSSRKSCGKSSALHRNLMVNSVLNKVRSNDKPCSADIFMNYREPRSIEMDMDEHEVEKMNLRQNQQLSSKLPNTRQTTTQTTTQATTSSKLSRTTAAPTNILKGVENCISSPTKVAAKTVKQDSCCSTSSSTSDKHATQQPPKRNHKRVRTSCIENEEVTLPCKKQKNSSASQTRSNVSISDKLPSPVDPVYSVTSLASLFNGLVANSEAEATSLNFSSSYVTAMLAC